MQWQGGERRQREAEAPALVRCTGAEVAEWREASDPLAAPGSGAVQSLGAARAGCRAEPTEDDRAQVTGGAGGRMAAPHACVRTLHAGKAKKVEAGGEGESGGCAPVACVL
jgi:hypothetical protein